MRILNFLRNSFFKDKYDAEANFWCSEIKRYIKWYNGEIKKLNGTKSPSKNQKIKVGNLRDNAILTWFNLHQKPKYLIDLDLKKGVFSGKKILDLGAGPMPSGLVFNGCDLYCLDPLYHKYLEIGFPIQYYDNVKFIKGYSEQIPAKNNFFDAVITVNAIDHVNNLKKTAKEIKRVLKKGGLLAMHIHYHPSTKTEPLEINDAIIKKDFNWCKGLKKVKESKSKFGFTIRKNDETYVLWRNF